MLTFEERQLAFALCCRMPYAVIAQALGITTKSVARRVTSLLDKTGMGDPFEFALQQNAAVRELAQGEDLGESTQR